MEMMSQPLDPGLTLWLIVGCPRLYRHILKHVSTSLVRNIDMLVDTHVHPSVGATRGRIPRLHARLHTSERGADPQLRNRSSISPRAITDFPLDGLRCLSPRSMTRILSSLAVRLSGCSPQTATPKAIRRHVRGGIASLVICWYETGGSAASTDTWQNLLSSFRQSLVLLLNLSSRPVTQMPKHRPSPPPQLTCARRADESLSIILSSMSQTKQIGYEIAGRWPMSLSCTFIEDSRVT